VNTEAQRGVKEAHFQSEDLHVQGGEKGKNQLKKVQKKK